MAASQEMFQDVLFVGFCSTVLLLSLSFGFKSFGSSLSIILITIIHSIINIPPT